MGKYDVLAEIANKLRALDNEVKLKILALLIEEGSKSITDISKELDINFSTAHKYLEQLEAAGLVTSKQVSENRLKRLFYVRDFDIELSPKGLSELISGKKKESTKGKFKVLNEKGELVDFDEKLFAQKYLKRGLPRGTIVSTLNSITEQAYDGVTLLELRELFRQALQKKIESIEFVFEQISESERHKRTYAHLLSVVHPEALEQHARGDIFIRNLRDPKLFNFVHDLRGLHLHGMDGKEAKNIDEFFQFILKTIKLSSSYIAPAHAFDSFNYIIAPLAEKLSDAELEKKLLTFLRTLNDLGIKVYVGLDIGKSNFATTYGPVYYFGGEKSKKYYDFASQADKINGILKNLVKKNSLTNIKLVFKLFDSGQIKFFDDVKDAYIVNHLPAWQTENASYVDTARFDSAWQGWIRTNRVGEAQIITLNLPRLALRSKDEKEFFEELKKAMDSSIEFTFNLAELTFGEFIRKHDVAFTSVRREHWNFLEIRDCLYNLALFGLNEVVYILAGKTMDKDPLLAEKILKFCNDQIKLRSKIPVRLQLKEESDTNIIQRFYHLDSKNQKLKVESYSPGICCKDLKKTASLQKYLLGGHSMNIKKENLKDFIKSNGGLAFIS